MNTRRLSYKYHGQSYCALSGQHQVDEGGDNHLYMKMEIMFCFAFPYALGCYKATHSWTGSSMGYKKFSGVIL